MTITTYKKWLYLKEGDAIRLNNGDILFYANWEHTRDEVVELYLKRSMEDNFGIKVEVGKESLIPIVSKPSTEYEEPGSFPRARHSWEQEESRHCKSCTTMLNCAEDRKCILQKK